MTTIQSDNKTIAKNTLMLYIRMFITIIVGLYTSRIVLNSLGLTDYGIYNLVGGIVSMLAFLNVGMAGASQRYISYELSKGNIKSLRNVFCTSIITHNTIAAIVIVIMESVGIWFINNKLNIPIDRLFAANWVFQCSIISFAVSVISVPYTACVIAHEKMGQFAYISILETFLRLAVAFAIMVFQFDKLLVYATLLIFVQISIRVIYTIYCKKNFDECTFKYHIDKTLLREMISFAGWGCIGNIGFTVKDQLSNIILNLFFGITVNAARGIATQVNSIINSFASNFTMALNPQITKQYALGNIERSKNLTMAGAKYSFFLISIISIPFLINEDYLLKLWLGTVPEYSGQFVWIILVSSCIYSMSHPVSTAILATGNVKWFQSLLAMLLLSEIPIAYVILKLGGEPYMALLPSIVTSFLSLILRILLLHKYVPEYKIGNYFLDVMLRCIAIFLFAYIPSYYIRSLFSDTFLSVIASIFISIVLISGLVFLFGLNRKERSFISKRVNLFSRSLSIILPHLGTRR